MPWRQNIMFAVNSNTPSFLLVISGKPAQKLEMCNGQTRDLGASVWHFHHYARHNLLGITVSISTENYG